VPVLVAPDVVDRAVPDAVSVASPDPSPHVVASLVSLRDAVPASELVAPVVSSSVHDPSPVSGDLNVTNEVLNFACELLFDIICEDIASFPLFKSVSDILSFSEIDIAAVDEFNV
jgi:hypothetical protein